MDTFEILFFVSRRLELILDAGYTKLGLPFISTISKLRHLPRNDFLWVVKIFKWQSYHVSFVRLLLTVCDAEI